jgi:Cysteine-rich secretory protein family
MKFVCFLIGLMIMAASAQAEDITVMISQYRREHGLPAVQTDPKLTAIAEHQAQAMASSGIMDHNVAGPFTTRIKGASLHTGAENIAAGTKTWADTLRIWKESKGHNENLLLSGADIVGVAVARNENTRYKVYWAMVIGRREVIKHRPGKGTVTAAAGRGGGAAPEQPAKETPISDRVNDAIKSLKSLFQ